MTRLLVQASSALFGRFEMSFVAANYLANPKAPLSQWVCTRTSAAGPYPQTPPVTKQHNPDYCGQCVSFVTTVCPTIPVNTGAWKKGVQVKGALNLAAGTAIATFGADDKYSGHAAIFESQNAAGISVVDQWVTPPAKAIHQRVLHFGAHGNANNGDNFFVIE